MRKIFLLLFCLIGLAASAQQTRPTTPVQKAQNSAYLDTSTGIRWYFDGVNWFAIPPYSPPNTLLTGLSMTVASSTLTVHTGTWRIGNVVYTLGSNTNFTLKPRDTITHYYRYEAVYAIKANNGIGLKVDSLTPSPIQHQFGTDTLTVGYVLVTPTGYQVVPPIPTNQFVFSNIGVGSPVQQVGSYPWVTSLKADTIKVGGHYILPPIDGTSGQVIQTDGAGNLFWSNQAIYLPLYPITISANNIGVDTAGSTRGLVTHTALMDTLTKNAAHFDNSFTISNDTIHLATTGVSPGSYTSTNLTVNSKGQITAASNGSGASYTATGGVVLSGTSFRLGSGTLQGGTVAISSPTTTNFSMSSNSGGNTVGMQMFSGVLQLTSHKSGNGTAFMQFTNPSDAETKMGYQNSTATTEKSLTFGIANKGVLWTDNVDTLGGQFASDYSVKQRLQRLSIPSVGTAIQIADSVVLAHPGTTYTASNGLNLSGTQFKLGGTLTGATSIAQTSTNKLTFTGYDIIVNNARVGIGGGNLPSNAALGAGAMTATNTGGQNTAVGSIALNSATTASDNTGLGWSALSLCVGCTTSVAVGSGAGLQNASGVGNVFLGYNAGSAELGSNKLYISNSSTTTPLIKGDFSAETVQVYGTLGSWTPAGTPGTDSVMVKHGNSYYAISPTYYGTGGSVNIYNTDGTLTGNRDVTVGANSIDWHGDNGTYAVDNLIDNTPGGSLISSQASNSAGSHYAAVNIGITSPTGWYAELATNKSGSGASIQLDGNTGNTTITNTLGSFGAQYGADYSTALRLNPNGIASVKVVKDMADSVKGTISAGASPGNPSGLLTFTASNGSNATYLRNDGLHAIDSTVVRSVANSYSLSGMQTKLNNYALTSALPVGANPTATAGSSAVNGSAVTFMRSDAAPKVDSAVFRTVANSYSLSGLQTKFNGYVPTSTTVAGFPLSSNVTLAALTATDATLTFSGSYTGATARTVGLNLGQANTWTAAPTVSLATAASATYGATLVSTTPATVGAQKWSPFILFQGNGWGTTGGASNTALGDIGLVPVQNGTGQYGTMVIRGNINSSSMVTMATFDPSGPTFLPALDVTMASSALLSVNAIKATANNGNITLQSGRTFNTAAQYILFNPGQVTNSSGTVVGIDATQTLNQSSTAAYIGYRMNLTETALGSGGVKFVSYQIAGTEKFGIDDAGITSHTINSLGTTTAAAILAQNTTAAALGAIQISPYSAWLGNNWATGSSTSIQFGFRAYTLPIQNSSGYNGEWHLQGLTALNTWGDAFKVDNGGTLTAVNFVSNGGEVNSGTFRNASSNTSINFQTARTFNAAGNIIQFNPGSITNSSGLVIGLNATQTINQTSTASYTYNQVNLTETAVGSGGAKFVDYQVAGTSKYSIKDDGTVTLAAPIILKGYTVSTLPTGTTGMTAYVTDALTPASLATVVGGGSSVVPVFYNGTNWIVQ